MSGHLLQFLESPAPATEPPGAAGPRRLTFHGTAGFTVHAAQRTLVLDPFVTRPGLVATVASTLRPNEAAIRRHIPVADDVLCGHSHHDHALDAPIVCQLTGARLIGSESTLNIGRAAGLPEAQMVRADGPVACGSGLATPIPSRHGRVFPGRIPLPGDIPRPPPWPPRIWDLRHGPVYNWLLDLAGTRILHVDSADFLEDQLPEADILLLCAVGRQYRRHYTRDILSRVRPTVVVPCHWDDFTLPFDTPPRQLPGVDVEGFVTEIRSCGARAVVLGLGQTWSW